MLKTFDGVTPQLGKNVFVADNGRVIGKVTLGEDASVWYGCVVRGDVGSIRIGARTNVQDLTVIHVTGGQHDTTVGADVTIGHRAVLHGCTVHDLVLIGMGAIILDGAVIESESLIGAGALVTPGTVISSGSLVVGSPGRAIRKLTDAEREHLRASANGYVELARKHALLQ